MITQTLLAPKWCHLFLFCLIWKISQTFWLSPTSSDIRRLVSLTSFPRGGVESQPRLQGCHLKKNFQITPPKWSNNKKMSSKKSFHQKLYICFLVKTSKKKSNSSQLIRCCKIYRGQTWIAQPLLKKLNGDFGPAQTGRVPYQPPSGSDGEMWKPLRKSSCKNA